MGRFRDQGVEMSRFRDQVRFRNLTLSLFIQLSYDV